MRIYQARMVIPNYWAEIGRCPICNMPTLQVTPQAGQPDQMACSSCGCGFEIEVDGPDIRLTWISPEYKQRLIPAERVWMSVADLRLLVAQPVEQKVAEIDDRQVEQPGQTADQQTQPPISVEPEIPLHKNSQSQEEVTGRAIELAELGNEPTRIRSTLARSSVSEEMIVIALEEIRSRKQKKRSSLTFLPVVTIIIVAGCLVAAAIFLPKFNLRTLIGLINSPRSSLDAYRRSVTPAPVSPGVGLPLDGTQYFNIMWNLNGSYQEKANQMSSTTPPSDLVAVHSELIDSFNRTGYLELTYQRCRVEFDLQNCAEFQNMGNAFCIDKNKECSKDNLLFLEEQTKLYSLWFGKACKSFGDYYSRNSVGFPFPDGNCAYP